VEESYMTITRRRFVLSSVAVAGSLGCAFTAVGVHAQDAAWEKLVRAKYAGTEIRVLAISHPATDAMRAMAPDFERATGIKLLWEVVGSGEIMAKQALAQTARDSSYDVYMVRGVSLAEYDAKKMLTDVRTLLKTPELTPADYDFEDIHPAYRDGLGVYNNKVVVRKYSD